ncbi:MAG: type II toxin-antitoxin system VapC family toxin [Actinomycetes bacterium]
MPTSRKREAVLVDTSVAVALVVEDHEAHSFVVDALSGRALGLCGHAAFETYSVLTRLPPPGRRSPTVIARVLERNFPATRYLGPGQSRELLPRLAALDIAGGSVYDALVASAAVEHALPLASRDRRAWTTYRAVGAEVNLLI